MFEREPILKPLSPFLKLLVLILIILVCLLFVNIIGLLIALTFQDGSITEIAEKLSDYSNPDTLGLLKFFQIINQLGMFVIPVIIFVLLADGKFWKNLSLESVPRLPLLLSGSLLMITSIPLVGFLAEVNQGLNLPESWSTIENWMIKSEDDANELMKIFLSTSSFGAYLLNMFMIALMAAVGEELLFRGALFRIFQDWTKNVHLTVFLTALFFSAFHLQFFGFLPRFMLGIFLGYMLVWSKNLWVPIVVHFAYNGFAVTAMFLASKGAVETDYDSFGQAVPASFIWISIVLTGILFYTFYYYSVRKKTI